MEPPLPIKVNIYRCDSTFLLDPIEDIVSTKDTYALVVLDGREATVATLKGLHIQVVKKLNSMVHAKVRKGGQSARRYERIIEESIGPGAGRDPPTLRACASAITYACLAGKNLVIDADGLLAINGSINSGRKENVVLTPNDKEAKALAGTAVDAEGPSSMPKRIKIAIHIARTYNASVILKGHKSIVTDGARVKVIVPKTATLATMGTGDVLSGILSFYLLQSSNAFDAAVGAAYLHAMVGDYIAANFGEHAIASDIIDNIPATISWISRGNKDIRK